MRQLPRLSLPSCPLSWLVRLIDQSSKRGTSLQVSVRFAEVQVSTSAGCTQAEFRWYRSLRTVGRQFLLLAPLEGVLLRTGHWENSLAGTEDDLTI